MGSTPTSGSMDTVIRTLNFDTTNEPEIESAAIFLGKNEMELAVHMSDGRLMQYQLDSIDWRILFEARIGTITDTMSIATCAADRIVETASK